MKGKVEETRTLVRVIDRMVREGKLVHTLIDGKPGVKLAKNIGKGDLDGDE